MIRTGLAAGRLKVVEEPGEGIVQHILTSPD